MNITELARRLKVPTTELKEKLPELGFDIGMRAIKVPDDMAQEIIEEWNKEQKRKRLEEQVTQEKQKQVEKKVEKKSDEVILLPPVISVRDLAKKLDVQVPALIAELMRQGVMAAISDKVEFDIATIVAESMGYATQMGEDISEEQQKAEALHKAILDSKTDVGDDTYIRPPVVVVMGHVDHGKTSLLDAIRQTQVTEGESGGITQHIGAYQVEQNNQTITFIDTPGHEAFSHMRSRGAVVADVAILVVAADDGVQPQTIEAIKMIQDANIPMVVAINKIDKDGANPDVVKTGLAELNIQVEGWGGDVPVVEISAKEGTNIPDLLEVVLLSAEVNQEKLHARKDGPASGVIIESHVDTGAGPVATVLIHAGTLQVGDSYQVGDVFGKIRALKNYNNETVQSAGPSTPVQIIGLSAVPDVGLLLTGGADLKKLRRSIGKKKHHASGSVQGTGKEQENEERIDYNVIIKGDVAGSLEAIVHSLYEIDTKEIKLHVISRGLGSVTEVDVIRASESKAVLFAFHTEVTTKAQQLALDKNVRIERVDVIYALLDIVKQDVESLLRPELIRHELGEIKVLKLFGKRDGHLVVGGAVSKGIVEEGSKFIVYRKEKVMGQGVIHELRIGPDKHREVREGSECGMKIDSSADIQEDDRLEIYKEEEKKRSL